MGDGLLMRASTMQSSSVQCASRAKQDAPLNDCAELRDEARLESNQLCQDFDKTSMNPRRRLDFAFHTRFESLRKTTNSRGESAFFCIAPK